MFPELISLLFFSRDFAHRAHLRTTSYAAHVALDSFYSDLPGLIDQLVEIYQGQHQLIDIPYTDPVAGVGPSVTNATPYPVQVLTYHLQVIEGTRDQAIGPDSTLQNIVDEIIALYRTTLYKLRFLN